MKELFFAYLQNSVGISVIGVMVMVFSPLLSRRYSAKCRYYIWLVIMAALAIPVRPQINISLPQSFQNLYPKYAQIFYDLSEKGIHAHAVPVLNLWQIAAFVWVTGALILLCFQAFRHFRFLAAVGRWSETAAPEIEEQLECVKAKLSVRRKIGIRFCTCIKTPMMIGFVKPVVLLPKIEFSADELRFVLNHELVHFKRKDLWYKLLIMLVSAVHWFNPIVHIMSGSLLKLCEISCDEEVLCGADEKSRASYGETIIGVIRKGRYCKTALSTNFYSGKRGIKERVHAIMDQKKKRFSFGAILIAAAVTLCAITAFVLSTPQKKSNKAISSPNINYSVYENGKWKTVGASKGSLHVNTKGGITYKVYENGKWTVEAKNSQS